MRASGAGEAPREPPKKSGMYQKIQHLCTFAFTGTNAQRTAVRRRFGGSLVLRARIEGRTISAGANRRVVGS